jgi:hypothetical protein
MSKDSAVMLKDAFIRTANEILAKQPDLEHSWSTGTRGRTVLTFPKRAQNGFDVVIEASPDEITVYGVGAHQHVSASENINDCVQSALGLARDLLSRRMRVREYCASRKPYRWDMEIEQEQQWKLVTRTALLLWNYFGRRAERIYQNDTLPRRQPHNESIPDKR